MSKDKYKVLNWPEYNEGLKKRGHITIWISPEVLENWRYKGERQQGGQYIYSDTAIEACLMVRKIYHLPYRQTQGFIESFFEQMHMELPVPNYSSICRRSATLSINLGNVAEGTILHIIVDSTGMKVYGEGEWKVRMHGWGKHRTWMKLHLALEADGQVCVAVELTTNAVDDAAVVEKLLGQIKGTIDSFTGDGAFDKTKVRKALQKRAREQKEDIAQIIAPMHNAVVNERQSELMKQRNEDIAVIKSMGREEWKINSNYHQRSKAETFMYRYKVILGGSLQAREATRQEIEVKVGCLILNILIKIAKPQSQRVCCAT